MVSAVNDRQVIFTADGVVIIAGDVQCSGAVEGQVVFTVDASFDSIVYWRIAVGDAVDGSFRESDHRLIRVDDIYGSRGIAKDVDVIQYQLHFFLIADIHIDLSVCQIAFKDIGAFLRDQNLIILNRSAGAGDRHFHVVHLDQCSGRFIIGICQIIRGKTDLIAGDIIYDGLRFF